ncbi:MAG: efflux RND transporter periplasmic adaptor subunit [Burkholderiales bacterium]|nr:efflux RND transporter periplasmic adaptor subunit [Burkholderiales bacterium]
MKRKLVGVVAAVAVLALGAGAAIFLIRGQGPAPQAEAKKEAPPLEFAARDMVQVTPKALAVELALPGTVQAVSQATVRAKLSAEVKRVLVREGERVAAGQVVAEFDTAPVRALEAERVASLEAAKAQLAQTERTRQVNAALVKQNFISQNAFDTADAAHRAQAAAVAAAQAQLDQTRLQLADAVVRAPIGGIVAKRNVQPGEKVSFDAPLLSIVDLSQLEVQAQAAVADVARVERSQPVEVEVEGLPERRFAGKVERINPSAEPGTRSIYVYVALANEDSVLKAGMFARVRLRLAGGREVPALPVSAVRSDGAQSVVWTIVDGKLVRRVVTLDARDERAQWVEIVEGLRPGDSVIATRFDNLREGMTARVVELAGERKVAGPDRPVVAN